MSNEQLDAVDSLDIGQLRRAAKLLNITAEKSWTKDDFVTAITEAQAQESNVAAVFDQSKGPKPGYARVLIHRDPTPNHANGPVHLGLNGRIIAVPRGGEFDIPLAYVGVLRDAVTTTTRQTQNGNKENPSGLFQDEAQTSYPFQVIAATPGPFVNGNDQRAAKYIKRKAFHDANGAWPTDGELKEFEKIRMAKQIREIEKS